MRITGTAARGAPITSATVTIKDKNGTTRTGTTDSNGKFSIDVSGLTTPLLLRIANGNDYLYSVATATGTTNIHPYTDLIIKNWFLVQGSSVEAQFTGSAALTVVPTTTEINTIEAVINSLLSANMSNASVPSGFNLLTSSFDANSTGFDLVLDNTQVVIDTATGGVTVTATEATTGITGTIVSTTAPITTAADTTVPTTPAGLAALPASTTSIVLTWDASTDNVGVAGYNVYRGGSQIATSPYPVYIDAGRASGASYCYTVEAFDGAGNVSAAQSSQACATPPASADATAPSTPAGLTATAVSSSEINLSWTASTDNVGVLGYAVFRGATQVAAVTGTSFSDIGLAAGTAYSYTIKAVDGALNYSTASASASATTLAGIPASPTNPAASGADGQTTVTWTAVSGATSYNLYWSTTTGVTKSSAGITGVTSPYTHTGRTNDTTYYYVVTAVNASGESVESAQVAATPSSGGSGSSPVGPNSSSGTYTWNAGTGTLTLVISTTNYVCMGPLPGTYPIPASVTATELVFDGKTYTRASGTAGNIVGTWESTAASSTVTTITFNSDATVILSGTDTCNFAQMNNHGAGGLSLYLKYMNPSQPAASVSVSGPGITGSVSLVFDSNRGAWDPGANSNISIGMTPPSLPATYTFSITNAATGMQTTETQTVSCYQQSFPTNLQVTNAGTLTFSWTGISDASALYGININDANGNVVWESYGFSAPSVVYGGPALTTGATYHYSAAITNSTACADSNAFTESNFTY